MRFVVLCRSVNAVQLKLTAAAEGHWTTQPPTHPLTYSPTQQHHGRQNNSLVVICMSYSVFVQEAFVKRGHLFAVQGPPSSWGKEGRHSRLCYILIRIHLPCNSPAVRKANCCLLRLLRGRLRSKFDKARVSLCWLTWPKKPQSAIVGITPVVINSLWQPRLSVLT